MSFSSFLFTVLMPLFAFSQNLDHSVYESALFIPWKFVDQMVRQDLLQYQYSLDSVMMKAQGVPIVISQPTLDLSAELAPAQVFSDQKIIWQTKKISAQIRVGGLTVEKDLEQMIGGIQTIVHLRATCSAFTLQQIEAVAETAWKWQALSGNIEASLLNMNLSWPADSWTVSPITCVGPAGFADLVQLELQTQLRDASSFLPALKSTLQSAINNRIENILAPWRKPHWIFQNEGRGLQLTMSHIENVNSKGLLFQLHLQSGDGSGAIIPLGLTDQILEKVPETPTLILSKKGTALLTESLTQFASHHSTLNEISSFQKLMRSRLMQFFVWPDLMRYPKSAIFQLQSQVKDRPQISFTGTAARGTLRAGVESWIHSERNGKTWNYLYLKTLATGNFDLQIDKGRLTLQPEDLGLQTTVQFFPEYLQAFHPSRRLSSSILDQALGKTLNQKSFSLQLPEFDVGAMHLQAQSLTTPSAAHFFIPWTVAPASK